MSPASVHDLLKSAAEILEDARRAGRPLKLSERMAVLAARDEAALRGWQSAEIEQVLKMEVGKS